MLAKGRFSISPVTIAGVIPGIVSRSFSGAVLAVITPIDLPTWAATGPLSVTTRQKAAVAIDSSLIRRTPLVGTASAGWRQVYSRPNSGLDLAQGEPARVRGAFARRDLDEECLQPERTTAIHLDSRLPS